jgi:hypothetical protein
MTSEISQRLKGKQDSSNPTESERRKKKWKNGFFGFYKYLQWAAMETEKREEYFRL